MIQSIDHTLYAEAFIGMGCIFFRRTHRPNVEAINDINRDVWTLFIILREHFQQFLDVLKWQISSREEFERLLKFNPDALTDLQRAARFLYLQRMTFGGKLVGRTFGSSRTTPARFDLLKLVPMLEDAHERLSGVVIERLPWADFVGRYDRPGALFYLDPPYCGCETEYGPQFDRDQLLSMPDALGRLKGRWILSINDHPDIRRAFGGFNIQEATARCAGGSPAPPDRRFQAIGCRSKQLARDRYQRAVALFTRIERSSFADRHCVRKPVSNES